MKYSPDAYLLHESGKFITYNIRIKVVMKEKVAADTFPKLEEIPCDAPVSEIKRDEVWFPGPEYLLGFAIFKILEEENIPYTRIGMYNNHLPVSKVENAPICKTNEKQ